MIVRVISNFVKACSEAYGEKLNVFCENFIKCENTIKTLGSANKGKFLIYVKSKIIKKLFGTTPQMEFSLFSKMVVLVDTPLKLFWIKIKPRKVLHLRNIYAEEFLFICKEIGDILMMLKPVRIKIIEIIF
jgi:hypothetical protein